MPVFCVHFITLWNILVILPVYQFLLFFNVFYVLSYTSVISSVFLLVLYLLCIFFCSIHLILNFVCFSNVYLDLLMLLMCSKCYLCVWYSVYAVSVTGLQAVESVHK